VAGRAGSPASAAHSKNPPTRSSPSTNGRCRRGHDRTRDRKSSGQSSRPRSSCSVDFSSKSVVCCPRRAARLNDGSRLPSGNLRKAESSADEVETSCALKSSWNVGRLLCSTSNSARPMLCSKRRGLRLAGIGSPISPRGPTTLSSGVIDWRPRVSDSEHEPKAGHRTLTRGRQGRLITSWRGREGRSRRCRNGVRPVARARRGHLRGRTAYRLRPRSA
jgi:hypothetical protein